MNDDFSTEVVPSGDEVVIFVRGVVDSDLRPSKGLLVAERLAPRDAVGRRLAQRGTRAMT